MNTPFINGHGAADITWISVCKIIEFVLVCKNWHDKGINVNFIIPNKLNENDSWHIAFLPVDTHSGGTFTADFTCGESREI